MNLCFTYESPGTVKSFTLFITVKSIAKLNPELNTAVKIWNKNVNISRCVVHSPDNTKFGHFTLSLSRTVKKCTKNYNARAQPLFCTLILLFNDVHVAVAVAVSKIPQFRIERVGRSKLELSSNFDPMVELYPTWPGPMLNYNNTKCSIIVISNLIIKPRT